MKEIYIYDALRTPIGYGNPSGKLYEVMPVNLLVTCLNAILERNPGISTTIEDCIIGCMTPVKDQGSNIAKAALMMSQFPENVAGLQINRLEGSALSAIGLGMFKVMAGTERGILAGGVESMSRIQVGEDHGPALYYPNLLNLRHLLPRGVAADLVAAVAGYSRTDLDVYTHWSYQKMNTSIQGKISPGNCISILDKNGLVIIGEDELEGLPPMEAIQESKALFAELLESGYASIAIDKYPELEQIQSLHTTFSSAKNGDAASLLFIGDDQIREELSITPRARILAYAECSTDPTLSWHGAQPAAAACLKKAGMEASDIQLWECDEPFSAVALKFMNDFHIPEDRFNINGGAIAVGQPKGASGALLLTKLIDNLEASQKNIGMVALPVSFGMGISMIIEKL